MSESKVTEKKENPTEFKNLLAIAKARAEEIKAKAILNPPEKRFGEDDDNSSKRAMMFLGAPGLGYMINKDIMIPDLMAGLIIGKSGETIKKIQAESGARVQVALSSHDGGRTRYVHVSGTPEQIRKAEEIVKQTVNPPNLADCDDSSTQTISEKYPVRADRVGLCIGKGGQTLRLLQERSGTRVTLNQELNPDTQEKDLHIIGTKDNIQLAIKIINEIVSGMGPSVLNQVAPLNQYGGSLFSQVNQYGTAMGNQTVDVPVPCAYIGLIIGPKGCNIKKIQIDSGAVVQMGPETKGDTRSVIITGTPTQITAARAEIDLIIRYQGLLDGEEFRVPSDKVGLVVGTKGETIKNIQQQSGAKVKLIQEAVSANCPFKPFILQGTPQQVAIAKNMIIEKIGGMPIALQPYGAVPYMGYPWQQMGAQPWPSYPQYQQGYYPDQSNNFPPGTQSTNGTPSNGAYPYSEQYPMDINAMYHATQVPTDQSEGFKTEEGTENTTNDITVEQQWQQWYAWQAYFAQQGMSPEQQQQYIASYYSDMQAQQEYNQNETEKENDADKNEVSVLQDEESLPPPPPPQ